MSALRFAGCTIVQYSKTYIKHIKNEPNENCVAQAQSKIMDYRIATKYYDMTKQRSLHIYFSYKIYQQLNSLIVDIIVNIKIQNDGQNSKWRSI